MGSPAPPEGCRRVRDPRPPHREADRVSATPVTTAMPALPAGYAWEATDEQVSERYGVPPATIVRFDLNTSPAPPGLALRLLQAGAYGRPISEYPPSDYGRLVGAAAETYGVGRDELLVGAGADEILDLVAKAFLPHGADLRHVPRADRAARHW